MTDDEGMDIGQGGCRCALRKIQLEHGQEGGVTEVAGLVEGFVIEAEEGLVGPGQVAGTRNPGDICLHTGGERAGGGFEGKSSTIVGLVVFDPIEVILFIGKLVIPIELVLHPQEDEGGAGNADGEADDIEERVCPVFPKIAQIGF